MAKRKRTEMAKRKRTENGQKKKDEQLSTKHYKENMSNMNYTKTGC